MKDNSVTLREETIANAGLSIKTPCPAPLKYDVTLRGSVKTAGFRGIKNEECVDFYHCRVDVFTH